MAKVHNYQKYDMQKDAYVRAPSKATKAWIAKTDSEIIPGTEEEVSESYLDDNGIYRPSDDEILNNT